VTVAPLTKLLPLIVSYSALLDPGTGLGDTLLTVGAETDSEGRKEDPCGLKRHLERNQSSRRHPPIVV
jgi:hypothetical protein